MTQEKNLTDYCCFLLNYYNLRKVQRDFKLPIWCNEWDYDEWMAIKESEYSRGEQSSQKPYDRDKTSAKRERKRFFDYNAHCTSSTSTHTHTHWPNTKKRIVLASPFPLHKSFILEIHRSANDFSLVVYFLLMKSVDYCCWSRLERDLKVPTRFGKYIYIHGCFD